MAYAQRLWLALALVYGSVGCGDDDGPEPANDSGMVGVDATTDEDSGTELDAATDEDSGTVEDGGTADDGGMMDGGEADGGTDAGDVDAGPPPASVTADDQTLSDLSTVVMIAEVVSEGAGWIVIHEDASGAAGPVIGRAAVSDGINTNVSVTLDRPAVDETLHAMLHTDAGTVGTYEFPGADVPVMVGGAVVMDPFDVTVAAGTPAVRITLSASGIASYVVDSVAPAAYSTIVLGSADPDPPLQLEAGWRYEVNNTVAASHPFELVTNGATPSLDLVQLSQAAAGALEGNASIDWTESGNSVSFTVAGPFTTSVNRYRCSIHIAAMRGTVTYP